MAFYSGLVLAPAAVGVKALLPKALFPFRPKIKTSKHMMPIMMFTPMPNQKKEALRQIAFISGEFQRDFSGGHAPYGEPDGDRTDDQKGEVTFSEVEY